MTISLIGAGAAGCFAAIQLARLLPHADIRVYERLHKPLAKVALTGGGRCNLTNSFSQVSSMEAVYPRGARLMKRLLKEFSHTDTMRWFEQAGVPLLTQPDQCVFPVSQNARDIVHCLLRQMQQLGVKLHCSCRVTALQAVAPGYQIEFADRPAVHSQIVIVTTGGSPRPVGLSFLSALQVPTVPPVPSLFSFSLVQHPLASLSGTVVEHAAVRLAGTKFKASGPLLVTHWGLSGPAILRLSSVAARHLHESNYRASLSINWLGETGEAEALQLIGQMAAAHPQKQVGSVWPVQLNHRLWLHLLHSSDVASNLRWSALSGKASRRLAARLTNHNFIIDGRNPYKEEFVTCGGVSLGSINPRTLECREHPGLYFAGEVLDVDAVTGGFNLQAAWTMGHVVAKAVAGKEVHKM